jgi:aldose 1-epimerase
MAGRFEMDGFAARVIGNGRLRATFLPGLNMLGASLTHDGEELLDLRDGLAAYADKGKTRGIPFLHPWANRLSGDRYVACGVEVNLTEVDRPSGRDALDQPIHGLLGGRSEWEIVQADDSSLTARFDFSSAELLAGFPFPHELTIHADIHDDTLSIRTRITATSQRAVPISFGFHPYFRLPGLPRERWTLTLPVGERLLLDERSIPTGRSEPVSIATAPLADRVFDDGYTGIRQPRTFVLEGGGRRIEVHFDEGFPFAQVYAPSASDFVCLEPMTAPTNALVRGGGILPLVQPGEVFSARWSIRVTAVDPPG